jgi:hypothetical protein
VEKLLTRFLQSGVLPNQLGVITPYEGQRAHTVATLLRHGEAMSRLLLLPVPGCCALQVWSRFAHASAQACQWCGLFSYRLFPAILPRPVVVAECAASGCVVCESMCRTQCAAGVLLCPSGPLRQDLYKAIEVSSVDAFQVQQPLDTRYRLQLQGCMLAAAAS